MVEITIKCSMKDIEELLLKHSSNTQILSLISSMSPNITVQNSKNNNYLENFAKKQTVEQRSIERGRLYRASFEEISFNGSITVKAMSKYIGVCERTIRRRFQELDGFNIQNGIIYDVSQY